ncbi:MAG: TIGR02757 family protein [Bacteroidetes bacterium]|nr:TIGR02757 family protein [Bacteroidota bacterium]
MLLTHNELFDFLEEKYLQYNNAAFIDTDPVSIPHLFSRKEDIEISGFLTAILSWGNRAGILKDARKLFSMMDCSPHDFILNASPSDLNPFRFFYHRTFNGDDCIFFLQSLKNIYQKYDGLEKLFTPVYQGNLSETISSFRARFLETGHQKRSEKHLANPAKGATAKRILMFLRWMVRNDKGGVDFGIWKNIDPSILLCPIDVHSGNVARKLGLLNRKSNDWKAVEELTANLRSFDPADPVKYDFALFGLGVFEHF